MWSSGDDALCYLGRPLWYLGRLLASFGGQHAEQTVRQTTPDLPTEIVKSASSLAAVGVGILGAQSALQFVHPDCENGPLARNTVCNVKASAADRAAALVQTLNITEKVEALISTSPGAPRVGLPTYEWWNEALHGVGNSPGVVWDQAGADFSYATSFASPITLSAAFDDDLVFQVASAISTEARAFANAGRAGLDFWTPNVNPFKDPRWGRGAETPGEDTFRIKGYTKALLSGLEGNESTRKIVANCKHYAAYDLEDWNGIIRHSFNAIVSLQDLSEYYLPAFQQCARDSNVGSIMCSYNEVNGTPACASSYLQNDILRDHWGWVADDNWIVSDCDAVNLDFLPRYHNYSQTTAEAAAAAWNNGMDAACFWTGELDIAGAHNQSLLSEATIDRAVQRIYHGIIKAGYFDPPELDPYRSIGWSDVNTPEAQQLALRSAAEGIVLLKNDGVLPLLNLGDKTIALIGFWANATDQLLGPYPGTPPFYNNPESAAQTLGFKFVSATGPLEQTTGNTDTWTTSALAAAAEADVILFFGGTDESIASEGKDRTSIAWPAAQLALVATLAELGKPLIVVQLGDQVDDSPLLQNGNISAILWTGYGSQAAGTAVLDVITGKTAPAGRLPVTQYPASYVDEIPLTDMTLRNGPGRTYRWYNASVLSFGYGLHYTTFQAAFDESLEVRENGILDVASGSKTDNIVAQCSKSDIAHLDLCTVATVPVTATNVGDTTSDFAALMFLTGEFGPTPYPLKTLVAYKKLHNVKPGETASTQLSLTLGSLARVDESGNLVLYPGKLKLLLDEPTQAELEFELGGRKIVLDVFPQPKDVDSPETTEL